MTKKKTSPDAASKKMREGKPQLIEGEYLIYETMDKEAAERLRAEMSLRESEATFRSLVEKIPAVVYMDAVDEFSTTLYISPQIETMTGYTSREWMEDSRLWINIVHPDDHDRVWAEHKRTNKRGGNFRCEYRLIARDGHIVWIRDEAALLHDAQGKPLHWQGFLMDITDRKQAEESLRDSEERYRRLFDLSPDAIAVHSGGKILLVNKAAMEIAGAASPEEIVGKPMLDFVHPDYRQLVLERTRQQFVDGKVVPVVGEKFIRLDGAAVDVEVTAAPIHFRDTVASLVIFRDIAERTKSEEKLNRQFKELAVLHAVGVALTQAENFDTLIQRVIDAVGESLFPVNFGVLLVDEKAGVLRHHPSYRGDATPEERERLVIPLGAGVTGAVARSGQPRLVRDVRKEADYLAVNPASLSELCVPLKIGDKVIGVINTESPELDAFSENDERLLLTIASQMSLAIEKLRLFETERLRRHEAETLRQAAQVVTASLDVNEIFRLMLAQLKRLFAFDTASVLLLGESGQPDLVVGMDYANEKMTREAAHELLKNSPILNQMAQDLNPLTIPDVSQHPGWIWVPGAEHVRSFLAVPLIARQRMIGALMADSVAPGFFSADEVRIAQSLAQHMSIALENARLYQQALQAADRRAILHRVSQDMVTAIREPEQTYQSIHQATRQLMPCDSFVIALHNEASNENTIVYALEGDHRFPVQHLPAGRGLTGRVVASGESIIVDDLLAEKTDVIRIGEPQPVRSLAAVPLRLGQKTTGMISAQSYKTCAFGPEEQALLEMLASYAAVAIENARLYQEAVRAAERRSILHEVSQEIVKVGLDLERVYEAVHHAAERLMPAEAFVLSVLDETHHKILFAYLYDEGKRWPSDTFPEGSGLSGRVIETGKALIINDLQSTPLQDGIDFGEGELVRSILAVPLRLGAKVFGTLSVQSYQPGSYTEDDQALLEMLGAHAAVAIENARLYSETRRRLTELEAVNRISTALRMAQTAEQMLPRLLDETLKILESEAGAIWLYNQISGTLEEVEARGWFTRVHDEPIVPNDGIAGKVFSTGEPAVSGEFASDDRTRAAACSQAPPGWGGACVPIRAGSETIGVLFVSVQLPRLLNQGDVDLLTTITEIAGNAIHRSRLYEQSQRHLQRLASLRAIDMAISTVLDLRVTLSILIDHILSQLRVNAVAVLLLNPNTQMLHHGASAGFRTDSIKKWSSHASEGLSGQVARTRATVHVLDLAAEPLFSRTAMLANEGFVTYFGVPLLAKGRVKGVLEIFQRSPLNPDVEWKNFLETLAGQAAIAIENASLFEDLQKSNVDLSLAYDATIEGWSRALDLRDRETEGHTQRVAELTIRLAQQLGVSDADQVHIRRGALLHDIGKMGVPDSILHKAGPLTDEEWQVMRRHPAFAYEMLYPISYLRPALDIPYGHHERWDGSGYPRQLKGEQVPLAARIFAIVDVWDALMSDRPYRPAWTKKRALAFIRRGGATIFDPQIVAAFLQLLDWERGNDLG
ncbi:MAG: putative signaling protein [Anaerolineaceae bacterium]|nr:MAG: putative signaling protein [Anaerolineaceae bacterium]